MAYVLKNTEGLIVAVSSAENLGAGWTFIEDSAPEYLAFLEQSLLKSNPLRESDHHMARVLEDLITLLLEQNMIRFTDFPAAAQKRLHDRQTLRRKTQLSGLLDDDDLLA